MRFILNMYKTALATELSRLHLWLARTPRDFGVSRRPSTPRATRATEVQGLTGLTELQRFTGSPGPPGPKDSQVSQHKTRHMGLQDIRLPGFPGLTVDPWLPRAPGLQGLPRLPGCGGRDVLHSYHGKRKICQHK